MLTDEGVGMAALYWCGQFTWGDFRLRTRPRSTTKCSTLVAVLTCLFFGQLIFLFSFFLLAEGCMCSRVAHADSVDIDNAHCAKKAQLQI